MDQLLPRPAILPAASQAAVAALASAVVDKMRFTVGSSQGYRAPVATVWEVAQETELLMGMHEGEPTAGLRAGIAAAAPDELRRTIAADRFRHMLPAEARPGVCLVVGGAGAESALHADPFDWTGWSLLLAGRKEWRFFGNSAPPLPPVATTVEATTATAVEATTAQAGAHAGARAATPTIDRAPAATAGERFGARGLGASFVVRNAPAHAARASTAEARTTGVFCEKPLVSSPTSAAPPAQTPAQTPALAQALTLQLTLVQGPGEVVIFPGGRFHQVSHVEGPTLALCGQACDRLHRGPSRALTHASAWRSLGGVIAAVQGYLASHLASPIASQNLVDAARDAQPRKTPEIAAAAARMATGAVAAETGALTVTTTAAQSEAQASDADGSVTDDDASEALFIVLQALCEHQERRPVFL